MISTRVCYKSNLVPQWGESTMYQILPNEVQAVSLHACMHTYIHDIHCGREGWEHSCGCEIGAIIRGIIIFYNLINSFRKFLDDVPK